MISLELYCSPCLPNHKRKTVKLHQKYAFQHAIKMTHYEPISVKWSALDVRSYYAAFSFLREFIGVTLGGTEFFRMPLLEAIIFTSNDYITILSS